MRKINSIEDLNELVISGALIKWAAEEMTDSRYGVMQIGSVDHVANGLESLALARLDDYPCGHFVHAVESNNLTEAFARADDINRRYMEVYVKFQYNYLPTRRRKEIEDA